MTSSALDIAGDALSSPCDNRACGHALTAILLADGARKRLLIAALVIIVLIAAGWFFGRYPLARWGVRHALSAGGLEPAVFEVESVGLGTLRVANLSVGSEPWLTAASAEVTFTLSGLLASRVRTVRLVDARWTVRSQDGSIDWGYVPTRSAEPTTFEIPCDLIEVRDSVVRVLVDGAAHEVELAGQLAQTGTGAATGQIDLVGFGRKVVLAIEMRANDQQLAVEMDGHSEYLGASWDNVDGAAGLASPSASATPHATWHAVVLREQESGAIQMDLDLTLNSIAERTGGLEIALSQASVTGHMALDEGELTGLTCSISAQGLRAGSWTDFALTDAHAELVMREPGTIEVTSLGVNVGDGSIINAEPFTWDLDTPRVQARLSMSNLSLAHWLPIITNNHATGEGRLSGHADVVLDWSTGSAKIGESSGSLAADPEHGFIQVTDAGALGDLLEKQDPRFATDEVMRGVRDRIIAALGDFAFTKLTVDFTRHDDRTVALAYLSGFGRHGDDPQGVNLTLDLHTQDSFIDLASRIVAKSRVNKAARTALEEFFQESADGQEKR